MVFSLAPITCFVFYRRFRHDLSWRPLAGWTLAAGIVLTLGIGVLEVNQQPGTGLFPLKGLVQRAVLVTFMAWLFTVAARLHHNGRRSHPGGDAAAVHGAGLTTKRWFSSFSRGGDQVRKTVMAAATPLAIRHLAMGVLCGAAVLERLATGWIRKPGPVSYVRAIVRPSPVRAWPRGSTHGGLLTGCGRWLRSRPSSRRTC